MNWIKKNPAQFSLALISVLLLVSAVMVYSSISEFPTKVKAEAPAGTKRKDLPKPEVKEMEATQALVSTPGSWQTDFDTQASLFVSKAYVLNGGRLESPEDGIFNPPVPNKWLIKYKFDPTLSSVLDEDGDNDGFSNLLEWKGMDGLSHWTVAPGAKVGVPIVGADGKPLPEDPTDPTDSKIHPPYHTRLEVANIINIQFRLKFMAAETTNKIVTAQINSVDRKNATLFLDLPGKIPDSKFTAKSYKEKIVQTPDGGEKDLSELTIVNDETKEEIILTKGIVKDSPESFVVLRYLWTAPGGQPTKDMNKKKGETFTLPPENEKQYKVVEIKPLTSNQNTNQVLTGEVTIALPSGQTQILKYSAPK